MSGKVREGCTIFCTRHSRPVDRVGDRIRHLSGQAGSGVWCDSAQFRITDVKFIGREDAVLALAALELLDHVVIDGKRLREIHPDLP